MCAKHIVSKVFAIALAMAVALALCASAFAAELQPCNADATLIDGKINASAQTYSVTVKAPSDATKVKFDATLYQKKTIGRKEVASMSASANSRTCAKAQNATIESGKTYVIEVTAQVYSDGAWDTIERTITKKA